MSSVIFFALAAYGLSRLLATHAPSQAQVPEPDGQGVGIAVPPPGWNPAAGVKASEAYEGLPPGTPVVYVDANGQVRETNAVYLAESLGAAVLMRDTAFLPQSEEPPRLAPGTGDRPGDGYLI